MFKRLFFFILILCNFSIICGRETRVLSFDGGGIRGAASLKILKELQKETGVKFHQEFDVFAGTSTGSMIALALACGMDIDLLLTDYEEMSAGVFSSGSLLTLFRPKYNPNKLKNYIIQTLEACGYSANATLGDLSKKIVIPIVSLDDAKEGRWRLEIRENFTKEGGKIKVVDAILESTAAPTYFPSHKGCVDGGMAMKDPSLAALMTAFNPNTTDLKNFRIFSIGTGYDKDSVKGDENWGIGQWMTNFTGANEGTVPLIELLMDVEEQMPEQVCTKLLGKSYKKIDFPLTQTFGLDDYPKIPALLEYTENYIKNNPEEWSQVCSWLKENILY
ncbi:MAG: putative sporulation hydrolase CotR [Chlamydiae bacterium]|nr:putative sporulation hydrolase CotR [Chlamydiota bacterium]